MPLLWKLIWPLLLMLLLPLAASWFVYPVTHLPPGFGVFPPLFVQNPPGFNLGVFILVSLAVLVILALLIFPQWFGFKKVTSNPTSSTTTRFPVWFWLGILMTGFFWWLMWARTTPFGDLVYYAFSPLWWGFILVLDGIVYKRTDGYSLLASRTKTFIISIIVSVVGWYFFEYFNYFTLGNWYYPNSTTQAMPDISHSTMIVIYLIAYTTVWPAIFEWYTLFNTFPKFANRYIDGPKIALPANLLLWGGLVLIVVMVFFPYPLFWAQWIATLTVLAGTLMRLGIPTPFDDLAQGNWSPMILMALASMINGFFWELWNYGSAHPELPITNPNYWQYDIPYVNVIHIFSDMPLLGYFGYLPFGLLTWVIFIWAGKVFNFNTKLLQ